MVSEVQYAADFRPCQVDFGQEEWHGAGAELGLSCWASALLLGLSYLRFFIENFVEMQYPLKRAADRGGAGCLQQEAQSGAE